MKTVSILLVVIGILSFVCGLLNGPLPERGAMMVAGTILVAGGVVALSIARLQPPLESARKESATDNKLPGPQGGHPV
jgi:hypothetical protein